MPRATSKRKPKKAKAGRPKKVAVNERWYFLEGKTVEWFNSAYDLDAELLTKISTGQVVKVSLPENGIEVYKGATMVRPGSVFWASINEEMEGGA